MKYIRTKDGHIYKVISEDVAEFGDETYKVQGYVCKSKTKGSAYKPYIDEYKVIKQADTIEELCDEFVIVCEDSSLNTTFKKLKEARIAGSYFECNHEYYGAIWTDKGLIYVAKMNEKGEFELL